jgi:hypothetical protein
VAIAGAAIATTAPAAPSSAACPLKPNVAPRGGDVQWAFAESSTPSKLAFSYTHGRGNWTAGRASGTACHEDWSDPRFKHNVVISVRGPAHLATRVKHRGVLGVALTLPLRVSKSDDAGACPVGTRGTAALFASYHEVHRDSLRIAFGGRCPGSSGSFSGSQLHVLIARSGHQVG